MYSLPRGSCHHSCIRPRLQTRLPLCAFMGTNPGMEIEKTIFCCIPFQVVLPPPPPPTSPAPPHTTLRFYRDQPLHGKLKNDFVVAFLARWYFRLIKGCHRIAPPAASDLACTLASHFALLWGPTLAWKVTKTFFLYSLPRGYCPHRCLRPRLQTRLPLCAFWTNPDMDT